MSQKIEKKNLKKKWAKLKKASENMTIKYFKNEDGEFVCPECGAIKHRQNSMHYHMKKHLEELTYTCKSCNKGFLQKQTLELHLRSKHPELIRQAESEEKKFVCPFEDCDFKALTKGNCIIHCLRVHFQDEIKAIMNIDNETKMITCNGCDKEFSSSSSFYYHCKDCVTLDKSEKKVQRLKSISV